MSFLLKTVLGVAAIEAVLLLLLVIGSNSALADSLDTELEKRAETTLSLLAATASDAVLTDDLATLDTFVDSDWAGGKITRKSTSGGAVCVGGGVVKS